MSVTFDGPNQLIIEDSVGGDNTIEAIFIYSRWKEWIALGDNSKYLRAFTVSGGEPFLPGLDLGNAFFLANGWRIRPAELTHKLTIDGNMVVEGGVGSIFVPTIGAFNVQTETLLSNLVQRVATSQEIAAEVWAVLISTLTADGTTGKTLADIAFEKIRDMDQAVAIAIEGQTPSP